MSNDMYKKGHYANSRKRNPKGPSALEAAQI